MIKSFILALPILFIAGCANAKENTNNLDMLSKEVSGDSHRERYKPKNASEKQVDNKGLGDQNLWGVRNMRTVLNGVYYRGGANNVYFNPKRENMNPLPNKGLENLCQEGFSEAVYLYTKNFDTAPKETKCRTFEGNENTLTYVQISPLTYKMEDLRKLHDLIFDRIRDSRLGPIYDHCWNGWHASGYVAATALRQFCDFTAEEAVAYWNINTDGNNDSSFNKLRDRIRNFTVDPTMKLTEQERALLCPKPGSLEFQY